MSDSQTTLSRWSKPEKVSSCSAKSKRFAGWALEVAYLRFLPVKLGFIKGDENSLADLFSRIASVLGAKNDNLDQGDTLVWAVDNQLEETGSVCDENDHDVEEFPFYETMAERIHDSYLTDSDSAFNGMTILQIYEMLRTKRDVSDKMVKGRFILSERSPGNTAYPLLFTRSSYQISDDDDHTPEKFVLVIPKTARAEPSVTTVLPLFKDGMTVREELLVFSHDMQGHAGIAKTAKFLREICWWPKMIDEVKEYVATCEFCSRERTFFRTSGFQIVGRERFSRIQMDHKILPDRIKDHVSYRAILTIVDTVSGMTSFSPVRTLTSAETALTIFTNWVKIFGIPEIIQTDNSTSFTDTRGNPNEVIAELCRLLGTRLKVITAYNPTANGRVERRHRDLGRWISSYEGNITDDRSLSLILAMAEISVNHFSDAHLISFGKPPRTIANALTQRSADPNKAAPMVTEELIQSLSRITSENSEWNKLLLESKARYNAALIDRRQGSSRKSTRKFEVGMQVLYDNRKWTINSLSYGPSREIPTTALLLDAETSSSIRVKYEHLRPVSQSAGLVPPLLDQASAKEMREGRSVFYGTAEGVYAGRILKTWEDLILVHMLSPNALQTIYHPNWWTLSEEGNWEVVRAKNKPNAGSRPLTQLVSWHEIFGVGEISITGRISNDLKAQLHSRGVFQASNGEH